MKRYRFIFFIIAFFCLAVVSSLMELQVIGGDEYLKLSQQRLLRTTAVKAPRGEILDRDGCSLVDNETVFAISIYRFKDETDEELNSIILELTKITDKDGIYVDDSFPVSYHPYKFTGDATTEWLEKSGFGKDATPSDVIKTFKEKYHISPDYTKEQERKIIGIRYEMERTGFSKDTHFTFAEGISETAITEIKERNLDFPGVVVTTTSKRKFSNGNIGAHILGRVGKIYKEEYKELSEKGYSMNDVIGKQGIEKYCESYLRGVDGLGSVEQSLDGREVKIISSTTPQKGNNVVLTIDTDLQKAAETAIVDAINTVNIKSAHEPGRAGADAKSGALVAIDVNTGEILAMVSYPSYNPDTFSVDYSSLIKDDALPLLNRAIGGAYAPGSTFKMVTALAALEEGVIEPSDTIRDLGKYKFFNDYQPACWIYNSTGGTHGVVNVSEALKHSCNYFFYDVGRRTTIEKIDKYAALLGLGSKTGIELSSEENPGRLASPKEREKNGQQWMPGDTLQMAIGQSDNMFTPLQLVNYVSAIVNGGIRYKPHLVKAVRSSSTGEIIMEESPSVISSIDIDDDNLKAIMEGMRDVVELGTASTAFENFNVKVGGKTGTAEVPSGSDNALFVGFAPYDKPTIAICAVIEHGVHGSNAAVAVRAVLDEYFNGNLEPDLITQKNTLLK